MSTGPQSLLCPLPREAPRVTALGEASAFIRPARRQSPFPPGHSLPLPVLAWFHHTASYSQNDHVFPASDHHGHFFGGMYGLPGIEPRPPCKASAHTLSHPLAPGHFISRAVRVSSSSSCQPAPCGGLRAGSLRLRLLSQHKPEQNGGRTHTTSCGPEGASGELLPAPFSVSTPERLLLSPDALAEVGRAVPGQLESGASGLERVALFGEYGMERVTES